MMNLHPSTRHDTAWTVFLSLILFAAVLAVPEMAMAEQSTPISQNLCKMVVWMTGTTGRAIATLAIIIIGVGALMGKVSWGMAIIVALGVAIVFGAPQLVALLGAGGTGCGM